MPAAEPDAADGPEAVVADDDAAPAVAAVVLGIASDAEAVAVVEETFIAAARTT